MSDTAAMQQKELANRVSNNAKLAIKQVDMEQASISWHKMAKKVGQNRKLSYT
ncbi:hypothetical protein [Helicobacter pullorum]|uniref:hypothetical protein n=1 Tax=Helicobacter pullorum TaxID=35818 RepID=UPI001E0EAF48|nr:hypothetical protein [Helicobacter pullorum]HJF83911.1 hypothetical protein [Helicobacter pullorum]